MKVLLGFEINEFVKNKFSHLSFWEGKKTLTMEELLQKAKDHQAEALVITFKHKMNKENIDQLPKSVKVISTSSVGFDHIDLKYAHDKKIIVTNTPDVLTDCTADLTLALMLSACRRLPEYQDLMRKGWDRAFDQNEFLGMRMSGKTLGILGMGRIGQAVARRAMGFGMKILYSSRNPIDNPEFKGATYYKNIKEMLPHCDILTLHAPGTPETNSIINEETLALLPSGAVFVNVARGSLVDEKALLKYLINGHLKAAALDVFQKEPSGISPFVELKNVVLAPHMGSATLETRSAMWERCLQNIDSVRKNIRPKDQIN